MQLTLKKPIILTSLAFAFTLFVPALGYISFGPWPAILFLIGYLSGFLLWLLCQTRASFSDIRSIYWLTFFLFFLHRIEEKVAGFFDKLAEITQIQKPEVLSGPIIALVLMSAGSWFLAPLLYSKRSEFGAYLIWTFFASMGITELAHFVLPLFTNEPYGYFPGMASVVILAPVAWIAMGKMTAFYAQNG